MSLTTQISSLAVRIGTEFKSIRTLISGSGTGDISGLATTDKTSLVAAINEVKTGATGGSTTLDGLTDVTVTTPAGGDVLRNNGSGQFVNVQGDTYWQPRDSDLDAIATLTTTAYGRALLSLADQAALKGAIGAATTAVTGVARLATTAETTTGTDATIATTPAGVAAAIAAIPADPSATTTVAGRIRLATQTEVNTGTDATTAVAPSTLQTRLAAYAQPLDSDLTAIAALTTTSYGRAFLALANQAALVGLLPTATTAAVGLVALATVAQGQAGTDAANAMTAAATKAAIDQRIINDAALGGASPSATNAPSVASVKAYADALIGANDAMVFKGVIDASTNPNYPASNRGDTYKVSVAGKIGGASGPNVEVGDMLIAITDGTAAGTQATVGAQWTIVQANIDGAVTGPASSTAGDFATFSGTTGKVVQDSGISLDTSGTLAANSDTRIPSQKAVRTYAQPLDAELTAIAGLASAADTVPYFTGSGAAALATFTAFGRSLAAAADAATARTALAVYSTADIGDPTTDFVATFNAALA